LHQDPAFKMATKFEFKSYRTWKVFRQRTYIFSK